MNKTSNKNGLNLSVINHAIDQLANVSPDNTYGCDLHNKLFNEDYFIIGYANAEKWLIDNVGIFQSIEDIRDYEKDHFGEISTDFSSSEKVCNMWVYIEGENVMSEIAHLQDVWDVLLSQDDLNIIKSQLESLLD